MEDLTTYVRGCTIRKRQDVSDGTLEKLTQDRNLSVIITQQGSPNKGEPYVVVLHVLTIVANHLSMIPLVEIEDMLTIWSWNIPSLRRARSC